MSTKDHVNTLRHLLWNGVDSGLPNIDELMDEVVRSQDSALAYSLSIVLEEAKNHHYEHYLEKILQ